MTLDRYLVAVGITQRAFARQIGTSDAFVCQLLRGVRRPSPDVALRISAASGGEVTVAELLFPSGVPSGARLGAEDASGTGGGDLPGARPPSEPTGGTGYRSRRGAGRGRSSGRRRRRV